jgi:uncharacterized LabA/DUF88 family protein
MADADEPVAWVVVLLDWQNIYKCAREAFGLTENGSIDGTVDPLKLARHVAGEAAGNGRLQELRVYRGRPKNDKDPKGYAAWRSQTAAWKRASGSMLIERYRDLRYRGEEVGEKGVDVWLAVDLVKLAMDHHKDEYDRVVVVSSDTDLVPALELAVEVAGTDYVSVAGWQGHMPSAAVLNVKGVSKCRLDRTVYDRVRDEADYNLGLRIRKKSGSGWDEQIQAEGRKRRDRPD